MKRNKQTKSYNSVLREILSNKFVAFVPCLGRLAKSATAGLFMSQLLYWWGTGLKPGWVYKTIVEFQKETCLSRSEQDIAIRQWKVMGVLEVKLMGIPPKRHFKIHFEKLVGLLREVPTPKPNLQNPANQFAQTHSTYGGNLQNTTESTAENTTKNTNAENSLKNNPLHTLQKQKQNFLNTHTF